MLIRKNAVRASECTALQEWKLSSFLKAVEEISIADVIRGGLTKDRTLERGLLWVISALSFRFDSYPRYDDTVYLETFALKRMRRFFPRAYVLYDSKGKKIAAGTALWCLIDQKTRSSIDPAACGIRILPSMKAKKFAFDFSDFAFPRNLPLEEKEVRTVRYTDLDLNGHMTNSRYADWLLDACGEELGSLSSLESFRISFHREAVLREKIRLLYGKEKPSGTVLEGESGGKKVFEIYLQKKD